MFGDFPLKDKIVVVTGGGSGIGLSVVDLALEAKAKHIIIADLRLTSEATALVETHESVVFQQCDVSNWHDLQKLIDVSKERLHDVPDVYVANAGVFEPPYSNFWDDPEGMNTDGYKAVDINVNHPIKLTRLAIRACLGANKKGVVAITASIAGYSKQYVAPIYSATKHAVVGFTRSMGEAETLQGVKVVAIAPGIVDTEIWTTGTPGSGERFGITDSVCISARDVASVITETIQSSKFAGGTIREVSKLGTRVIPDWHIAPVGEVDGKMAEGTDTPVEALQHALAPILAITAKERGRSP